jgi:2-polyprenyl-6-methoxyphenol hydroxylase-like FAD-dependent oxidoreductase
MKAGVVGAGIGGLAAAIGLQRVGVDVTVFERYERPTVGGSGLSLFGNGLAAMQVLGLSAPARQIGAVPGAFGVDTPAGQRRPDGRWLARVPAAAKKTVAVVHRADLHRILIDALAPGTVRTGQPVDGVSADGRSVLLSGGNTETFDVVVAADGIRSRVRREWPDDPGVRYAGYRAWRGVTGRAVEVSTGSGETIGRGLRFGIAPLVDGRVYWFAVVSQPIDEPAEDGPQPVLERFAGWHRPIEELINATPPEDIHALPIEELAGRLPSFRRGRCVLLGDAAHAMTPNLGQGGNQAMEDAATLAALLAGAADAGAADAGAEDEAGIDAALAEYDRLRRPRTQRIAHGAGLLGRVLQARGPIVSRLRDTALRLTPAGVTARSVLAVQRWQPPSTPVVTGGRDTAGRDGAGRDTGAGDTAGPTTST